MSAYDHTAALILPVDLTDLGNRIARALDPDTGGDRTFGQLTASASGMAPASHVCTITACIASFARNTAYLLLVPDELYQVVAADYAARWPDLECPTLDEVTRFCEAAKCYVDTPLDEALAAEWLKLITQEAA